MGGVSLFFLIRHLLHRAQRTTFSVTFLKKVGNIHEKVKTKTIQPTDFEIKYDKKNTATIDTKNIAYRERNRMMLFYSLDEKKQLGWIEGSQGTWTTQELDLAFGTNAIRDFVNQFAALLLNNLIIIIACSLAALFLGIIIGQFVDFGTTVVVPDGGVPSA